MRGEGLILLKMLVVYSIRGVSGIGTLLAILLIGHFYTSVELASYSLFMFLFNLVTIVFLWGDAIGIVDSYNATDKVVPVPVWLGYKMLDGVVVVSLLYGGLLYFGHWNYGLMGGIPVGLMALLAALLVVKKRIIMASLCFEFSRALMPFVIMVAMVSVPMYIEFDVLVFFAYSFFWLCLPVLFVYARKEKLWSANFSLNFADWLKAKRAGVPVLIPQIMIVLAFQADRLFINYWGDVEELASYFAAQTLYTVVLVAAHSTFNLLIPKVSKIASSGEGDMRGASRIMLAAQVSASLVIIPLAYIYLGYISVDKVIAMQSMLLLMAGGVLSACLGIGLPALQFCKRKTVYLKVVSIGVALQFLVIILGYSILGLYSVVLGFMIYNISTSLLAAWFWRKTAVVMSPFSLAKI